MTEQLWNYLNAILDTYNIDTKGRSLIEKAFVLANDIHDGARRKSGEPYIVHPLTVGVYLAQMKLDANTVCAGLLHDVIEDGDITKEELEMIFGKETAFLVDGVSKLKGNNFSSKEEKNEANLHKFFAAVIKDYRIILIKLADRRHNMETLQYMSPFKQKENALETLEVYVPLAERLGMYEYRQILSDLAFSYVCLDRYLEQEEYQDLKSVVMTLKEQTEKPLTEMQEAMTAHLEQEKISAKVTPRIKSPYGIYQKLRQGYKLEQIHDLHSLKIIVPGKFDCYTSLGVLHDVYKPVPARFKDYIAIPKTNLYQSLHSTVNGFAGTLVQVQIRTEKMDQFARFGVAAYYANKSKEECLKVKEALPFYRPLSVINDFFNQNNHAFKEHVYKEILSKQIYVTLDDGKPLELPEGSTSIDAAYRHHTNVGNHYDGIIINGIPEKIDYVLQNKDRVTFKIDQERSGPSLTWLGSANTVLAKQKIKKYGQP